MQWGGQAKYARETDRPLQNVTDYPLCLRDLLAVPKDYCGTATFTCDLLHRLRCKHGLVMPVTETRHGASDQRQGEGGGCAGGRMLAALWGRAIAYADSALKAPPPTWGRLGRGKPRFGVRQSSLASPTPTRPQVGGGGVVKSFDRRVPEAVGGDARTFPVVVEWASTIRALLHASVRMPLRMDGHDGDETAAPLRRSGRHL